MIRAIVDDIAQLAYLTEPSPAQLVLNLQFEQAEIQRIEINRDQLAGLVIEGAKMLWERNGGL